MLVDRRKDNYDELLVLARDARATRSRTNRWTTGIVVGAMAAGSAYVASMSAQIETLRDAKDRAEAGAQQARVSLAYLQNEHAAVVAQRDSYAEVADQLAAAVPNDVIDGGALVERVTEEFERAIEEGKLNIEQPEAVFALNNLVWYVDGSRRFPMEVNDVLWIPESRFWVRLQANRQITVQFEPLPTVQVEGDSVNSQSPLGDREDIERPLTLGPFDMRNPSANFEWVTDRSNANCVKLELDNRTSRTGFSGNYVDMIVTYSNNDECRNDYEGPAEDD